MIFDWLALNWVGLFVFFGAWMLLWMFILVLGNFKEDAFGAMMMVVALPCLWASNIPFWLGVIGLVCAIIKHFGG
jgi:hypothetical protein